MTVYRYLVAVDYQRTRDTPRINGPAAARGTGSRVIERDRPIETQADVDEIQADIANYLGGDALVCLTNFVLMATLTSANTEEQP